MKKLFNYSWIVSLFAMLALVSACSNDNEEPDPDPDPVVDPTIDGKTINPTWEIPSYSVTAEHSYTKAEYIDHSIGSYSALMNEKALTAMKALLGYSAPDGNVYHEVTLKYASIDHKNAPIELSGIVCYKTLGTDPLAIEQVIIDSHATITDDASCPSRAGSICQLCQLGSQTALVSADYQGYGVSRSALHPYLNEPLTARQQIDLLKAAVDYLSKQKDAVYFSEDLATYSIGYSQGGAVALATHRYLEEKEADLANALNLKGSVCGDGPYNLGKTLLGYLDQGYMTMPVILPMMVRSMMECYPDAFAGLTLSDFFTDELLNAGGGLMNLVDAKEMNTVAFNVLLGATDPLNTKFELTKILTPEALEGTSKQMGAMAYSFAQNNCIKGWTPKHPVCFFHSEQDTVVPFSNLDDLSEWPASIYKIQKPSTEGKDHLEAAMLFYTTLLMTGPEKMLTF